LIRIGDRHVSQGDMHVSSAETDERTSTNTRAELDFEGDFRRF